MRAGRNPLGICGLVGTKYRSRSIGHGELGTNTYRARGIENWSRITGNGGSTTGGHLQPPSWAVTTGN